MKILLTGFKPFNKDKVNPSLEVVKSFDDNYNNNQVYKLELDVEYTNDGNKVINKIKEVNPDLVLMIGLAGGRKNVTLEYMGVNVDSATIPDNKGEEIIFNEIVKDGPLSYKTNIDTVSLYNKLKDRRFAISYHAGTYVCNDIYYRTLDYIYRNNLSIKCGFVHLPFLVEQVSNDKYPSMELEEMKGLIESIIDNV